MTWPNSSTTLSIAVATRLTDAKAAPTLLVPRSASRAALSVCSAHSRAAACPSPMRSLSWRPCSRARRLLSSWLCADPTTVVKRESSVAAWVVTAMLALFRLVNSGRPSSSPVRSGMPGDSPARVLPPIHRKAVPSAKPSIAHHDSPAGSIRPCRARLQALSVSPTSFSIRPRLAMLSPWGWVFVIVGGPATAGPGSVSPAVPGSAAGRPASRPRAARWRNRCASSARPAPARPG